MFLQQSRHEHAIRLKAEIMVDHLHNHVIALKKIEGQAKAGADEFENLSSGSASDGYYVLCKWLQPFLGCIRHSDRDRVARVTMIPS